MVRRQHRVTAGLLGFILLLGTQLMNPPAMAATPPGGHLNITEVAIDNPNAPTRLMISGEDFSFGPGPLVVTLGDFGALAIVGIPTDTEITVLLPANIPPGDYLLTVARGTGQSQGDEYDLTIGAVGPQGPRGPGPEADGDRAAGSDRRDRAAGSDRCDRAAGSDRRDRAAGSDRRDRAAGCDRATGAAGRTWKLGAGWADVPLRFADDRLRCEREHRMQRPHRADLPERNH